MIDNYESLDSLREQVRSGRLKTDEMVLNMGPQHPSTHGVLRLELILDGEMIVKVIPIMGYLHRCFEKHAEAMTYPQVLPYTDRLDYLSSMNNNHGFVLAVERMLGIEVPERVEYIRVIMAELNRIASHLVAIGSYGMDIGAFTPFLYCFRDREYILDIFERTCGGRLLYNYFWVGGLSHDVYPDFVKDVSKFVKDFRHTMTEIHNLLNLNKIFIKRTANVGVLPQDVAINYGCSGPMLRGSGVNFDLRRDDPYSIYDRFDWEVVVGKGEMGEVGDCWDRHIVRQREMEQSCRIIEQALASFPEGDVTSAIPKRIRPPKGAETYARVENPRGELGYYVISDGGNNPFRVKCRAPGFVNLGVLDELSRGHLIADIVAILGSIDIVLGEIDR
jgi:NADH-quinone oxidoreductase subunit D